MIALFLRLLAYQEVYQSLLQGGNVFLYIIIPD